MLSNLSYMNDEAWKQNLKKKRLGAKEVAGFGAAIIFGGVLIAVIGTKIEFPFIVGVGMLAAGCGTVLFVGGIIFYFIVYQD
jgi:hypothetical protein